LLKWLPDLILSVNLIRESSLQVIYFLLVRPVFDPIGVSIQINQWTRKQELCLVHVACLMKNQK